MSNVTLITNMTKAVDEVIRRSQNTELTERQIATTIIAKMLAYRLPLPSTKINPPINNWYVENCSDVVGKTVNEVNESVLLDVERVMRLTHAIWRMRYNAVYDVHSLESQSLFEAILSTQSELLADNYREVIFNIGSKGSEGSDLTHYLKQIDNYL